MYLINKIKEKLKLFFFYYLSKAVEFKLLQ